MTSQLEEPQLEEPQEQGQGWLGSIARSSWPWWWLAGLVSLGSCSAVSLWPPGGARAGTAFAAESSLAADKFSALLTMSWFTATSPANRRQVEVAHTRDQ